MKTLVTLVAAFTIGAMFSEIMALREHQSVIVNQASEDAYWKGWNEGQFNLQVHLDRVEEDEPGWDCKTMGNKRCK